MPDTLSGVNPTPVAPGAPASASASGSVGSPSGQPVVPSSGGETPTPATIVVNGETLTQDQVADRLKQFAQTQKDYGELQKKFTHTSQELSQYKKGNPSPVGQPQPNQPPAPNGSYSPEQVLMRDEFSKAGVLTVEKAQELIAQAIAQKTPEIINQTQEVAQVNQLFTQASEKYGVERSVFWEFIQQNPTTQLTPDQIVQVVAPQKYSEYQQKVATPPTPPTLPAVETHGGGGGEPPVGKKGYQFGDGSAESAAVSYVQSIFNTRK